MNATMTTTVPSVFHEAIEAAQRAFGTPRDGADAAGADLRPCYEPSDGWTWGNALGTLHLGTVRDICADQSDDRATIDDLLARVEATMGRRFRIRLDDAISTYQASVRNECAARAFLMLDGLYSG